MQNSGGKTKLQLINQCFAILFACFHLYTALFGVFQNIIQRSLHVGGGAVLFLLLSIEKMSGETSGVKKRAAIFFESVIGLFVIFSITYLITSFDRIMHPMFEINRLDIIIGVLFTAIVLEMTRRLIGWAIPILAVLSLLYAYYGSLFPGIWRHNGIGIEYIVEILYFSDRGLWGLVTGISSTIIAIFMIFGTVLFATGGGKAFMDISCWATGPTYGGAAKLAAVASGLFGMISGSAAANVATTGAFTIPLMKRLGYTPEFAGGVESSASSGGQIMPPIMGAAAFIMAETLGVTYSKLALAAIIPSILFYFGVILSIHFEARRMNYRGIPRDEIPKAREIFHYKNFAPIFVPIFVLIYYFFAGYTPTTCALMALGAAVVLYLLSDLKDLKGRILNLLKGLADASREMLGIIFLIACAQILLAMIGLTGVGIKFTNIIVSFGQNSIILSGLCAMAGTMLLGMGLPTVAAYLVASAVMAPALVKVGVAPIAAHFFIFYYSIFAGITPPVCGTVFIGAAIAGANWLKTAWVAIRLSVGAYLVPFMFLFSPALLLVGSIKEIATVGITSTIGILSVSIGGMGFFKTDTNILERIFFIAGGLLLIIPDFATDITGIACFVLGLVSQVYRHSRAQPV
jgi:TRAP transporter 4TM/12TM fusion protein